MEASDIANEARESGSDSEWAIVDEAPSVQETSGDSQYVFRGDAPGLAADRAMGDMSDGESIEIVPDDRDVEALEAANEAAQEPQQQPLELERVEQVSPVDEGTVVGSLPRDVSAKAIAPISARDHWDFVAVLLVALVGGFAVGFYCGSADAVRGQSNADLVQRLRSEIRVLRSAFRPAANVALPLAARLDGSSPAEPRLVDDARLYAEFSSFRCRWRNECVGGDAFCPAREDRDEREDRDDQEDGDSGFESEGGGRESDVDLKLATLEDAPLGSLAPSTEAFGHRGHSKVNAVQGRPETEPPAEAAPSEDVFPAGNHEETSTIEYSGVREVFEPGSLAVDQPPASEQAALDDTGLSVEEKAGGLSLEEKAGGLSLEEKAGGLSLEEKAGGLSLEEKAGGLRLEEKRWGLTLDDMYGTDYYCENDCGLPHTKQPANQEGADHDVASEPANGLAGKPVASVDGSESKRSESWDSSETGKRRDSGSAASEAPLEALTRLAALLVPGADLTALNWGAHVEAGADTEAAAAFAAFAERRVAKLAARLETVRSRAADKAARAIARFGAEMHAATDKICAETAGGPPLCPALKQGQKPGPKQDREPGPKQDREPGPKQDREPGPKQDREPGPKKGRKPGPKQGQKPGPKEGQKPGPKQDQKPGSKEGRNPGSKRGQKPGPKQDRSEAEAFKASAGGSKSASGWKDRAEGSKAKGETNRKEDAADGKAWRAETSGGGDGRRDNGRESGSSREEEAVKKLADGERKEERRETEDLVKHRRGGRESKKETKTKTDARGESERGETGERKEDRKSSDGERKSNKEGKKSKVEESESKEDKKIKVGEGKSKEDKKIKEEERKSKEDKKIKEEERKSKEDKKIKEEERKSKEDKKIKVDERKSKDGKRKNKEEDRKSKDGDRGDRSEREKRTEPRDWSAKPKGDSGSRRAFDWSPKHGSCRSPATDWSSPESCESPTSDWPTRNVSWVIARGQGREASRSSSAKSDWLFDRAAGRRRRRDWSDFSVPEKAVPKSAGSAVPEKESGFAGRLRAKFGKRWFGEKLKAAGRKVREAFDGMKQRAPRWR